MAEYGSPSGTIKFLCLDYQTGCPAIEYKSMSEVPENLKKFAKPYTPTKGSRANQTFYRVPISSANAWITKIQKRQSDYGEEYQIYYNDQDEGYDAAFAVRCKDLSALSLVWSIFTAKEAELKINFGNFPVVFHKGNRIYPITSPTFETADKIIADNPKFEPHFQTVWNSVVDFVFADEPKATKEIAYAEMKKAHKIRVVIPTKSKAFFEAYATRLSSIFDKKIEELNNLLSLKTMPTSDFSSFPSSEPKFTESQKQNIEAVSPEFEAVQPMGAPPEPADDLPF